MPRIIELGQRSDAMTVDECASAIASSGFDARCEASVLAVAGYLKALGENRTFLGDWMIGLLAGTGKRDGPDSSYSAQSIMLTAPRNGFFLRANIWPSERDSCFRRSGAHSFAYGAAHDHNFDFLTYGYLGPGYRSDYYEYDHQAVTGYRGEPAGLRFIERSALHEGKLMHYRAHRDVHSQLPPDSLSVSLNVMACDPSQGWYDQYGFDLAQGTVSDVLSTGSTETFLRAAVAMGGEQYNRAGAGLGPLPYERQDSFGRVRSPGPCRRKCRGAGRDLARCRTIGQPAGRKGSRTQTAADRLECASGERVDRGLEDDRCGVTVNPLGPFAAAEILPDHVALGTAGGPTFVPQQHGQVQRLRQIARISAA